VGSNLGTEGRVDPRASRHIKDLFPEFDQLQAAAESARQLTTHPGWVVLSSMLDAEISAIDRVLDGDRVLGSRAEYAGAHGRRGGIRASEEALRALIEQADVALAEQRIKHEGAAESASEV
jgi:hypothetical protein